MFFGLFGFSILNNFESSFFLLLMVLGGINFSYKLCAQTARLLIFLL